MSLVFSSQTYSTPHSSDQELVKQLTDLIRQNVPYSKRLDVLGILSYTTDNGCERFIKIDSSFSAANECLSENFRDQVDYSRHDSDANNSHDSSQAKIEFTKNHAQSTDAEHCNLSHSPGASPPLLPPSVIQINKTGRADEKLFSSDAEARSISKPREVMHTDKCDSISFLHRRGRRKCRNPKRQIVDSDSHVGDSDIEDASTDVEDSAQPYKLQESDQFPHKVRRLEISVPPCSSEPPMNEDPSVTPSSEADMTSLSSFSSAQDMNSTALSLSANSAVNSVSFLPLQYATVNKYLNPQLSSSDISVLANSQLNSGTKYAISAKSLGFGDLGDLCGILPINALLGKTLVSGNDANATPKLMFANNIGTSVPTSSTEIINQPGLSQQITQCISSTSCTNHNLILNPNIAAAVAAAISNSSLAFSSSNNPMGSNSSNLSASIPTLTAPSIALTGPSGELLGTIPIASANSPQNVLSSALGNHVIQPSSAGSSLTTVSVTLPTNPSIGSSTGLANTLNWLRCATASTDPGSHQVLSNFTPPSNASSFSMNSGNPVALLQSLVTQQQQQSVQPQIQKQQSLSSTFSVGPTLALIGTLGLNTPVTCNGSGQHLPESPFASNAGLSTSVSTFLPTTLHNNVQASSANNNAALVAAALLRSLTSAKQSNQEPSDPTTIEGSPYTPPASLTLITNNIPPSISVVASTRTATVGIDESGSILANRISQPTLNVPALSSSLNGVITSSQAPVVCQVSTPTQTLPTRNSIMLSYPRGGTEMNLLLTPASAHPYGTTHLTSLTAVPTALSFQGLSTTQTTGLTLTSPVLVHTPVTSTVTQTTSVISETTTTNSSYVVAPSTPFEQNLHKSDKNLTFTTENSAKVTPNSNQAATSSSDPTSSAIDRILQTIKGCMNASASRESDNKIKVRKNESSCTYQTGINDDAGHRTNEIKKAATSKFVSPNKNCIPLENDCASRSASTNDRLPLPPLHKSTGESSDSCSSLAVNKIYRCRYCGKTFNRKFCRERHERLHTGVKPYSCEICDEKFIRLEDKKRHVRSLQHYLSGRSSLRSNGMDEQIDECAGVVGEPSNVLPLLAQTLQGGINAESESTEKDTNEISISADEPNFGCRINENGSEDTRTIGEYEVESYNPEHSEQYSDNNKSVAHLSCDGNQVDRNLDSEDSCEEEKIKLENPSDDLLTNLRLTSKIQINRTRCRTALKETQTPMNPVVENHCEVLKIPTVYLNTDETTNA